MHYLTVQSLKSAAVLIEDGAFALFFGPAAAFDSSSAPAPTKLPCKAKKKNAYYPEGGIGTPGIN